LQGEQVQELKFYAAQQSQNHVEINNEHILCSKRTDGNVVVFYSSPFKTGQKASELFRVKDFPV